MLFTVIKIKCFNKSVFSTDYLINIQKRKHKMLITVLGVKKLEFVC